MRQLVFAGQSLSTKTPVCPMGEVVFSLDEHLLHEVGQPGWAQHIAYEEFDAAVWGLETRLARPGEEVCRCLHGGDSAATVASMAKGCSRTQSMNRRCRKVTAICPGYDLHPLNFYKRSEQTGLAYAHTTAFGGRPAGVGGDPSVRWPAQAW